MSKINWNKFVGLKVIELIGLGMVIFLLHIQATWIATWIGYGYEDTGYGISSWGISLTMGVVELCIIYILYLIIGGWIKLNLKWSRED